MKYHQPSNSNKTADTSSKTYQTTQIPSTVSSNLQIKTELSKPGIPLTPSKIMQLQRTFGNRAVTQLLISRMSPVQHVLQGEVPEEEQHKPIQKKENNTGMPDNLKSGLESLSGMDLSDVKVHYNSVKPSKLSALAYAQGNEIHIGPGQEQHLPHEGWHVVQQKQDRVRPTLQMKSGVYVNDDLGLEKEADVMGAKALTINSSVRNPSDTMERKNNNFSIIPIQRTSVMIEMSPNNENIDVISEVRFTRGKETTGGPHTTAHLVFEEQVWQVIFAASFDDAYKNLINLFKEALNEEINDVVDDQGEQALKICKTYESIDPNTIKPIYYTQTIQKLALNYILLRSSMAGAINKHVDGKKQVGEDSENNCRKVLDNASGVLFGDEEVKRSDKESNLSKYVKALLGLFDYQSAKAFKDNKKFGTNGKGLFERHIRDIFRAFPIAEEYEKEVRRRVGDKTQSMF